MESSFLKSAWAVGVGVQADPSPDGETTPWDVFSAALLLEV